MRIEQMMRRKRADLESQSWMPRLRAPRDAFARERGESARYEARAARRATFALVYRSRQLKRDCFDKWTPRQSKK